MVQFNINEKVKFRLTEHGEEVLAEYIRQTDRIYGTHCAILYPKDCLEYRKMQIHELANIFGKHMYAGAKNVIENNTLVFCGCE